MAEPDSAAEGSWTIGAVVDALAEEFPGLTISKIRFLESKGLVSPPRAASGYRRFRTQDIERIRYVLTAQRDNFWPLKVIQEALDAMDRGLSFEGPSGAAAPSVPEIEAPDVPTGAALTAPAARIRLTRRELCTASGLSEAQVESMLGFGLLTPDAGGHFDGDAVLIGRSAAALASYGLEPRHLRSFRTAADREIGLVEQVVSPLRSRDDDSEAQHEEAVGELLREFLNLHAALVRAGLARHTR